MLEAPPVPGLIPSRLLLGAGTTRRTIRLPYVPHPVQRVFHDLLPTHSVRLYGGAMGGGKTYAICGEGISLLARFPGNRIAYARKTRTAIKRTTWTTFLRLCPRELIRSTNAADLVITLHTGSEAIFLGADTAKDPLLEDLKSLEVSMFYLEEATQLSPDVFPAAIQRKDRWQLKNGVRPPGGLGLTCNPEIGWVKETFFDPWARGELPAGMAFVPALPADNPDLSEAYLRDMRAFLPPDQIARYLEGKWEAPVDPNALISYAWLKEAMDGDPVAPGGPEVISCDVAFEGDDDTEIWGVRWGRGAGKQPWEATRLAGLHGADEVAVGEAVERAWLDTGTRAQVVIDATGIGSGVATFLQRQGIKIIRFKGGGGQVADPDRIVFRNLRDQAYWNLRQELAAGRGTLPDDSRLVEELAAIRYRIDPAGRKVEVERKVEVKKRLRRSTDRADALAMAVMVPRLAETGLVRVTVIR
jgi:hypothetical protein